MPIRSASYTVASQDEYLSRIPRNIKIWKKEIPEYLNYYNSERPHMALNYQTPLQVVRSY